MSLFSYHECSISLIFYFLHCLCRHRGDWILLHLFQEPEERYSQTESKEGDESLSTHYRWYQFIQYYINHIRHAAITIIIDVLINLSMGFFSPLTVQYDPVVRQHVVFTESKLK